MPVIALADRSVIDNRAERVHPAVARVPALPVDARQLGRARRVALATLHQRGDSTDHRENI